MDCNNCRYGPGRQSRQQSLHKLAQLQQNISGWEGKDIVANCSEIVFEGKLKVIIVNCEMIHSKYIMHIDTYAGCP